MILGPHQKLDELTRWEHRINTLLDKTYQGYTECFISLPEGLPPQAILDIIIAEAKLAGWERVLFHHDLGSELPAVIYFYR